MALLSDRRRNLGYSVHEVGWNQQVKNGDFSNNINDWVVGSPKAVIDDDGSLLLQQASATTGGGMLSNNGEYVGNPAHRYYVRMTAKSKGGVSAGFKKNVYVADADAGINYTNVTIEAEEEYTTVSSIISPLESGKYFGIGVYISGNPDTTANFKEVMLIDLTAIYGEGNEPATAEEFERDYKVWFGRELTYEPYDKGSVRKTKPIKARTPKINYDAVEVEYLETAPENGGGFINTGYIPKSLDIEIQCGFMPIALPHQYSVWFSNGNPSNNGCNFRVIRWSANLGVANYGTGDHYYTILPITEYGKKYDIILRNGACVVNGESVEIATNYTNPETNTTPITIFDRIDGLRTTYGRCYYFRILQNDEVILDLIPVRIGNTGYMYDKVSGKLFGNEGSGKFILGPDIVKPYDAEVEYIEANAESGDARINTQFRPDAKSYSYFITFMPTGYEGVKGNWFSTKKDSDNDYITCNEIRQTSSSTVSICFNRRLATANGSHSAPIGTKHEVQLLYYKAGESSVVIIDGEKVYWGGENVGDQPINPLILFNNNSRSAQMYGRLYAFRVEQGTEVVLDLIPVRKDGVAYMYDKISGELMGCSGTGTFIIGPDK